MRALVLAAVIAATEPAQARPKPKDDDADRRLRAVRRRFTEADLEEMFGDMEPTRNEPAATPAGEPDFIRWDPEAPAPDERPAPPIAA